MNPFFLSSGESVLWIFPHVIPGVCSHLRLARKSKASDPPTTFLILVAADESEIYYEK